LRAVKKDSALYLFAKGTYQYDIAAHFNVLTNNVKKPQVFLISKILQIEGTISVIAIPGGQGHDFRAVSTVNGVFVQEAIRLLGFGHDGGDGFFGQGRLADTGMSSK